MGTIQLKLIKDGTTMWHLLHWQCYLLQSNELTTKNSAPLLSYNDVRELLVEQLANDGRNIKAKIEQRVKRHRQREKDIMRYYKNK